MSTPNADRLIDVVNGDDEPISTIARGAALKEGVNFRTTHIFVFNATGNLLLQQLAPSRDRHPGRWGSSVAAYVYSGESYREAAKRRMVEEIGLAVPLTLVGHTQMQDERSLKFIALFKALAEHADIRDHEHIAALRYWTHDDLRASLERSPEQFTPTFRQLYGTLL